MKYIVRVLIFTFLFVNISYCCDACVTSIPIVKVAAKKTVNENSTTYDIVWSFNKEYTKFTMESMPKFLSKRQVIVNAQKNIEYHLDKSNYLMSVSAKKNKSVINIPIGKIKNKKFTLDGEAFKYEYKMVLDIDKSIGKTVSISFNDQYYGDKSDDFIMIFNCGFKVECIF